MKYLEVTFRLTPYSEAAADVLAGVAAGVGFDSFTEADEGLNGYVRQDLFDEAALRQALEAFPLTGIHMEYTVQETEDKDWNAEWERNSFQPVVVDDRCVIHSSFHTNYPQGKDYDIVINPQMSFGTGSHATTHLLVSYLLDTPLAGRRILDMGCGTGILAILASMRGASEALAVDNDAWCVANAEENIRLNGRDNGSIQVALGEASRIKGERFDAVIANINRNILLSDMPLYVETMTAGAALFLSGFYEHDLPLLRTKAAKLGLAFESMRTRDEWVAAKFVLLP